MASLRGSSLRLAINLSCASAYTLFGYDQGVLGGLVAQEDFLRTLGYPSAGLMGTIMAMFYPACVVGSIVAATFGGKWGRRWVIVLGTFVMTVGVILQTAMSSFPQFIAGRIITGLGNGLITATVPMFVAETATEGHRGRMVCMQLNIVILGLLMAYWIDYGATLHLTGNNVWRIPISLQLVFSVGTLGTIMFLPESPRWLFSVGKTEKARNVLSRLFDCDETDDRVNHVMNEMETASNLERDQEKMTLKSVWHDKSDIRLHRRLMVCFLMPLFGQLTGINVMTFYLPIVLRDIVGLSAHTSSLVAGFIQLGYWVGTFFPIWSVERLGRRFTLLLGSVVLSISMILFTISLVVKTSGSSRLSLAMLVIFETVIGMSWNSIPWIVAPEITPLHLRHVGGALGSGSQYLWTTVIVLMAPSAIQNIGWKIYLLFDIGLVAGIFFIYFFLPETKGKSLEEIDYLFAKGNAKERLRTRFETADATGSDFKLVEVQAKSGASATHLEDV